MTDVEIAHKATELLQSGDWSRLSLARKIGIAKATLDRVNTVIPIPNYPKPMTASQAAKRNRLVTKDKWSRQFKLRGSPSFGERHG